MTRIHSTLTVAIVVALLSTACSEVTRVVDTSPLTNPPAVVPFPAVTRPATIYRAPDALYGFPSRYVVYDDGTFALQFTAPEGHLRYPDYAGRYTRTGTVLTFDFERSDQFGNWIGTGALRGEELHVTYSEAMQMDFAGGTYLRVRDAS